MPKLAPNVRPAFRRHASGQAFVQFPGGKRTYLGRYDDPAARDIYNWNVAEWEARERPSGWVVSKEKQIAAEEAERGVTFADLAVSYFEHIQATYEGEAKVGHVRSALRIARAIYGPTPARAFGPLALKAVREAFVEKGWNRTYVNQQTDRLRAMFKWAIAEEVIAPSDKTSALAAVEGLKQGRTKAPEPQPVRPVSQAQLEAVIACSSPPVAAMLQLQRLTGMRPGEVCRMTVGQIDRSGELWVYRPAQHKGKHRGETREVYLGAKAQQILAPFLTTRADAYLFRPADGVEWHNAQRAAARKTPRVPSSKPAGVAREVEPFYDVDSYRQAIEYACNAAFPLPPELARQFVMRASGRGEKLETVAAWKNRLTNKRISDGSTVWDKVREWRKAHCFHPHQIRHTAATELRRTHGLEAAAVMLGHKQLSATQIYAEQDVLAAQKIARENG